MSNFLAVDTSSRYLTVIAKKGERVVKRFIPDCALNHSVILMDEVDKAFDEAALSPKECDFFAAVTGPGSFTGIRIGISTAKGFALGTGKKLLGVTSFDLISYNVLENGDYLVAIDAAHGHYYVCGYNKDKGVNLQPCYLSCEDVQKLGLPIYGYENLPLEGYNRLEVENCLYPAICANECNLTDDIAALYVRKSQAEEGRKC
jgi:tRNA threonylcarbamoyl adenosine modification protein YeaZ